MKIFPGTNTTERIDACPACAAPIELATGFGDDVVPEPGAFSVCFECGALLRYGDDLSLRRLERGELRELPPDRRALILRMQRDILARPPLPPLPKGA